MGEGRACVHDRRRHKVLNVRCMDRPIGRAMAELGAERPQTGCAAHVRPAPKAPAPS